jgi:teichuronic acid biosynthesis glycosyltransferase TuaC
LLVRALVVSNMRPSPAHPERGRFVRDQVDALRGLEGVEVELYEFAPGARALARAAVHLRRRFGSARADARRFDVVHAHYGLTAWPALAAPARVRALTVHGTDVHHPRTRLATRIVLPRIDLLAAVSSSLAQVLPGKLGPTDALPRQVHVLPCGVDLDRFRPLARERARAQLGLDPERPYLLFAADPDRPEKRYDRAEELARRAGVELLALGGVDPELVGLWVNAANAVLVTSEREGFGLAVLEALACDVPVLATPVGVHADALAQVAGTLCAPFDLTRWAAALAPHLRASDPRVQGRVSASRFSSRRMAELVVAAWGEALEESSHRAHG